MYRPSVTLLYVAALWLPLLPSLRCDNLRCFFSPLLEKAKASTAELVHTECPPNELCFLADGRYGNYSALSARGCMAASDCGQTRGQRVRGTMYTMSYTCCDWNYCNASPRVAAKSVPLMLILVVVALILSNL